MLKSLLTTSVLTAISVVARGLSLLLVNKLLATVAGPSAYTLLGNFQNVYAVSTSLATGSTAIGITKYTAEHYDNQAEQSGIWRAGFNVALFASAVLAVILLIGAEPIAGMLIGTEEHASLFRLLAISLFPTALNLVLLSILNGKKAIASFVIANIAASIALLILSFMLVGQFGVTGVVAALIFHQAVVLPLTLYLAARQDWFSFAAIIGRVRRADFERLAKFALMAIVSAVTVPIAQYFIRLYLTQNFGLHSAGLWEAVNRFSAMYLLVVISPLTVYYLPRLSEIRLEGDLRREVLLGYSIILPIAGCLAAAIYLLRVPLIHALFSDQFLPMADLMGWQAVGDVLKIGSWLLGFIMLARGMQGAFIATEIVFSGSSVVLVMLATPSLGLLGAPVAYAVNYAAYWIVVYFIVRPRFHLLS